MLLVLYKLVKVFFSLFLLFATGFIIPVNKDYQISAFHVIGLSVVLLDHAFETTLPFADVSHL